LAFSPFDSPMFSQLYGDTEVRALFSDSADVRAMLLVEGSLANVQGEMGIIPLEAALYIHRSSMEVQIDPAGLAGGMGSAGVPVPALVDAFRKAMEAPEHAQYIHWGATSQDIVDTALILRLRQYLGILDRRLGALIAALTTKAKENRDVVMAARTRSQMSTPTTFGAKIATWVTPLKRHRTRLSELRERLLVVSLAGASGNYAALGSQGREVEAALAKALKLSVAETPWHNARDGLAEFASVLSMITGSLGKIGQDLMLLSQNEIAEVSAGAGGGSSTMPHKANPVSAEVLVTMAQHNANQIGQMHQALVHSNERDGVTWALERLVLPQMCIAGGVALLHAQTLAETLKANPERMLANIIATNGQMMAEAAMFALAEFMPRPEAQALVKTCSQTAARTGQHLREVLVGNTDAAVDWDDVFNPANAVGLAGEIVDTL